MTAWAIAGAVLYLVALVFIWALCRAADRGDRR
jgi:hypothetical protein